jgi:hypothetical protein
MPLRRSSQSNRECLPESRGTPAHDFALAHKFGIELGSVEREVNIEVNTIECALRRVHALKVLFKILAAKVRGQGDDFLDAFADQIC